MFAILLVTRKEKRADVIIYHTCFITMFLLFLIFLSLLQGKGNGNTSISVICFSDLINPCQIALWYCIVHQEILFSVILCSLCIKNMNVSNDMELWVQDINMIIMLPAILVFFLNHLSWKLKWAVLVIFCPASIYLSIHL